MAEEVREQVSDILQHRLADPRLSWISVVRAELSPDFRYAKVYVSVLGDEETQERSLRVLHRARRAVRAELSRRMRGAKRVPEITFHADHSIEYSLRIEKTLKELGFVGDEPVGPDDPAVDEE
jgi:ribosome-binding factor A